MRDKLYTSLLKPHSQNQDLQSREIVLNFLLIGVISLSLAVFTTSAFGYIFLSQHYLGYRLLGIMSVLLFFGFLFWMTKHYRKYRAASTILVVIFLMLASIVVLNWGNLAPTGILLFGFVVVMGGVLLGSKSSLYIALVSALLLILFEYLKAHSIIEPNLAWMQRPSSISDILGFATIYAIIALVSWLFNRQMEQSLARAQKSEAALEKQNELLEQKVQERTRQLEAEQLEKLQQIYRFAELGRISSALFHDLANHLSSVSLNIEDLNSRQQSGLMKRVQHDISYIDEVVQRVRLQLRGQGSVERFNIGKEVRRVVDILNYKLVQEAIELTIVQPTRPIMITTDLIPFRQIISNLLSNAIDAYEKTSPKRKRKIIITLEQTKETISISVTDWGIGIPKSTGTRIFEPFYSNKASGTGIGLFIVRQIVEHDLRGSIMLTSDAIQGTIFSVHLPKDHGKNPLNQSFQAGIDFLVSHDVLVSESSSQQKPWKPKFQYHTTFVPSLILNCIKDVPGLTALKNKLFEYLVDQRSPHWSFNYWVRDSVEAKRFPYPDDLDDTFCALTALYGQRPDFINQEALAATVRLLIATETKPGGPYRTWLAQSRNTEWQDVDIAVNANILFFMKTIGSPLPPLKNYLEQRVRQQDFTSPYYPTVFPLLYYLARAGVSLPASTVITQKPSNSLELALTLSILLRIQPTHQKVAELTDQLLALQRPDGSWPAEAFCQDPSRNDTQYYHGSASLTTAFALEALHTLSSISVKNTRSKTTSNFHTKITAKATREITLLPIDLRKQSLTMLRSLVAADPKHHITLLPVLFGQSLSSPHKITEKTYVDLGLASLYGWMAYTIYDNFLDEEGQPAMLSVANWSLRSSLSKFQTIPNQAFQNIVNRTFDIMDNANTWEVTHCRWMVKNGLLRRGVLPNYKDHQKLAERSLGHSLAPIAILLLHGRPSTSSTIQSFQAAFRHYLIARQLDDDAHDWQVDLFNGHITYVVAEILREIGVRSEASLQTLIPLMQKQFWNHTLLKICAVMQEHIDKGRIELGRGSPNFLHQLFDSLETSVKQTRAKQKQARHFLAHYKTS